MRKPTSSSDPVQLDLFAPVASRAHPVDCTDHAPASAPVTSSPLPPEEMSDEALLAEFPKASVASASGLGAELIKRRPLGWQDAALKLWGRFLGFGGGRPTVEQELVLTMAITTADRHLVESILRMGQILTCFEPFLVRAAAASGVALPKSMVEAGLSNAQADARCAALSLAVASDVSLDDVYPYLTDPVREVRRAAAVALAEAGEEDARDVLLYEIRVRPSWSLLDALSFVANEDVVIRLGQLALQSPEWCEPVIAVLETIDHPTASKVIASLMR
jgi:hypothetical protein